MEVRSKTARLFTGAVVLLTVAGFILTVFRLLTRTELEDLYLGENAGWRYELFSDGEVRAYEPETGENGRMSLPEDTQAVRITRVMTEQLSGAQLAWVRWQDGIEVFLGGEPVFSDFPGLTRAGSVFVSPGAADWERLFRGQADTVIEVRMTLPLDYPGEELSVITYFPDGMNKVLYPEYPYLGSAASPIALPVVSSVENSIVMTALALMALLTASLFLMDSLNEHADYRLLLLCLFYLLLFLNQVYISEASVYSVLNSRLDLRFLQWSYMTPLFLYLALRLRQWWKWPLCIGIIVWGLYDVIWQFRFYALSSDGDAGSVGWGYLAVLAAIAAAYLAEGLKQGLRPLWKNRFLPLYCLTACALLAVYVINKAIVWDGLSSYLVEGVWMAVRMGNFEPLMVPITGIISFITTIMVAAEVIRRILESRRTQVLLQERSQLTKETYLQMEQRFRDTSLLRHEWKNQVTTLLLLAEQGRFEDLKQTLEQMSSHLTRLSIAQYSDNYTVNVLLQNAAARAMDLGVIFISSAPLPEKLGVDESDLCSLLINMLDNALEAASKAAGKRQISISLKVVQDILSVKCENSYSGPLPPGEDGGFASTKPSPKDHGWGIRQMRQVAEKYNGVLDITNTDDRFTIQTALSMRT